MTLAKAEPKEAKKKNLQYLNVTYDYHRKVNQWTDRITTVYRDEDTGLKSVSVVKKPEYVWYINNAENWTDTPAKYVSPDQVDEVTSKYQKLAEDVAQALRDGGDAMAWKKYESLVAAGKRYAAKGEVYLNPNVHGTDFDIRDYYIAKFLDENPYIERKNAITKMFYDIEVDIEHHEGFPDEERAECPVNIITAYFDQQKTGYVWILVNYSNPSQAAYLADQDARVEELEKRHGCPFEFRVFETELDMLTDFFTIVNDLEPDYCLAWNAKFDLITMINRMRQQAGDEYVEEVITSPKMAAKGFSFPPMYQVDVRNQDAADKNEMFDAASMSVWLDQLQVYAQLRKTAGKKDSYALDAVAQEELKANKDEMPDGVGIRELAQHDFGLFVGYNVQDVMLLNRLECKNKDVDQMHSIALMTQTRVQRAMAKTVCLRNFCRKLFLNEGVIMSNNRNRSYGDNDRESADKFIGAFVADPLLNAAGGITLPGGEKSKFIFENVIDMDLASLYPSIILALNIDVTTQFGKLVYESEKAEYNPASMKQADIEAEGKRVSTENRRSAASSLERPAAFADSMASGDHYAVGVRYFGLPTAEEVYNIIKERRARN
jgi:DNA polymerase elongation subunit (family B)